MAKLFVIDDDESTQEILKAFYTNAGYQVDVFSSAVSALKALEGPDAPRCELVVCDVRMPDIGGLEFLDRLNASRGARPPVILLTAHASVEAAVEGLGKGAFDYITKPINFTELSVLSERAIKVRRMEEDYRAIKSELSKSYVLEDIVGKSPPMQKVFDFIKRVSQANCNVLITGESGTGKEMVARAVHSRGPRAKKPFVAINCAAIPEALLESELFGHAKGSFTGATERRRGLLDEANEGTIFLDEIGDMPLALQAKLLRFVQEKKVKSVGENTYRAADVRIIAATHQNLKTAVREKKFREDLYYRICVAPIDLPPLRHRKEDILLLAEHFLEKLKAKVDSRVVGFTKAAQAKLMSLPWPGNVRELENTVERALVFCEDTLVSEEDIQPAEVAEPASPTSELFSSLMPLDRLERAYIEYVLDRTGNMKEKAAEVLGINRKTLYRKQREYGLASGAGASSQPTSQQAS